MSFWCLQFPPKNEQKQVDLRFHSSIVEFVRLFFGGNVGLKKLFRLYLKRPKRHFEINWSLVTILKTLIVLSLTCKPVHHIRFLPILHYKYRYLVHLHNDRSHIHSWVYTRCNFYQSNQEGNYKRKPYLLLNLTSTLFLVVFSWNL